MEGKKANKSSIESIERLNAIYQAMPTPTYTWKAVGKDFTLIDYNKAAVQFLDKRANELSGIKASILYKDKPVIINDFRKCFENKSYFERKINWDIGHSSAIKILNFKFTYIQSDTLLVQIENTTYRKEVGTNFLDHPRQQAIFIENSPAAIAMFDNEMRYISVSNKWIEDYKLIGKKIIGKSHYEIFPEIGKEWKAIHQHCLKGFIEKKEEDSFTRLDGSVDWMHWEIRPWYGTSEKVGGIMMFTENITRRKNAEEKLNEYKYFFENSNDFFNIADLNGHYEIVNPKMKNSLGYTEEELLENPYYGFIHPQDRKAVSTEVDELSKGTKTYNFQIRHLKKNGEHLWIEWNVIPDKFTEKIYSVGRDITERKKALEIIRYQFENAPDIILIVNRNFRIESINREIQYSRQELIGMDFIKILPPISRDLTKSALTRCFETGESQEFENVFMTGIWVRSRVVPMIIDGDVNKVMIFGSDITKEKQAKKELIKSEEKYRTITENITDAILLTDENFKVLYRSPANQKITGYSNEDFQKIDLLGQVHKDDLAKSMEGLQLVLKKSNSTYNLKVRIRHKAGHWLWIEGTVSNMLFNKSIGAVVISFRDITERIKAEEKLALSALIVNSSDDAIIGMTMDKTINSWNPGAEKIFGYTSNEVIGKPIQLIIPPNLHYEERIISENIGHGKPVSHFETGRIGKDGKIINVSITISPITDESGEVIGLSKIIRDISLRKSLEEERDKMIADLVQRNRDLEQFSYIISHNLRTPVANILGISSLMQSSELLPNEEEELLLGLNKSVNGLDEIIKDLNQILQTKKEINEAKVLLNLSDIISIIQSNISHLVLKENVTFLVDFSQKDEIFTIKSYLDSIFYNLISNSIKYKHPERAPVIEIKSRLKDKGFEILYKDNGLGIDLEKQGNQVFGLYKRFHFHTEGKGMGLFMVKTQIETLGGKVSIKSEVNHGTEFIIEFEEK